MFVYYFLLFWRACRGGQSAPLAVRVSCKIVLSAPRFYTRVFMLQIFVVCVEGSVFNQVVLAYCGDKNISWILLGG